MEPRKREEIEHYDRLAREWQEQHAASGGPTDVEGYDVNLFASYRFAYELLRQYVPGKRVLDYGCGHGMHTVPIAKMGANEVVGIDLSRESLVIARERAALAGVADKIKLLKMDAEALDFPDSSFDVVFDGGTFSSIDFAKGLAEIKRVLRPGGYLIGIETLGHNPLANLKRWLNQRRGIRTAWAVAHILKMKDLAFARTLLTPIELRFFHLTSLIGIPFWNLPGASVLVNTLEGVDSLLLSNPFLKRYAFKVLFVYQRKM